jgi:hypothetical protein
MENPEPQPQPIEDQIDAQQETQEQTQEIQKPIIEITSHPLFPSYKLVVINGLKVRHELMFNPDAPDEEIINDTIVYILEYENTYPETEDPSVWEELISLIEQGAIE